MKNLTVQKGAPKYEPKYEPKEERIKATYGSLCI